MKLIELDDDDLCFLERAGVNEAATIHSSTHKYNGEPIATYFFAGGTEVAHFFHDLYSNLGMAMARRAWDPVVKEKYVVEKFLPGQVLREKNQTEGDKAIAVLKDLQQTLNGYEWDYSTIQSVAETMCNAGYPVEEDKG